MVPVNMVFPSYNSPLHYSRVPVNIPAVWSQIYTRIERSLTSCWVAPMKRWNYSKRKHKDYCKMLIHDESTEQGISVLFLLFFLFATSSLRVLAQTKILVKIGFQLVVSMLWANGKAHHMSWRINIKGWFVNGVPFCCWAFAL